MQALVLKRHDLRLGQIIADPCLKSGQGHSMKLHCSKCCHEIELAGGELPPPWCQRCGSDFKTRSFGNCEPVYRQTDSGNEVEEGQHLSDVQSSNTARLFQCGGCGWKTTIAAGARLPPWCAQCGADIQAGVTGAGAETTAQSIEGSSAAVSTGSSLHDVPPPEVLQPFIGQSGDPNRGRVSSSNIGQDERFASHNFLVGTVLALWGFLAASGMAGSPDQDVLDSHPTVMSIIDGLQVVAMLTGVGLVVSGIGLRSGQRWGLRLAAGCTVASILSGVVFLAVWQFLRSEAEGGEMVEAVAVMTFVRQNLDLLIGLVDGGALIVFLAKHRAAAEGQVRRHGTRASGAFAR